MSSRQEEKERRRQERMEAEAKAQAAARNKRRLQMVGGVVLVAAVAVVAIVLATSGGSDDTGDGPTQASDGVPIPRPGPNAGSDRLDAAAKAAGCVVRHPKIEGSDHVEGEVEYDTNPPTSGPHNVTPAASGVYEPGNEPAKENYVHSLEHGRILFQYKPGTPPRTVQQLETLFAESDDTDYGVPIEDGSYTLLFQNNTNMPYQVAASAWGHFIGCERMNDRVFDALRAFRARYTLQGPEKILQEE
jgi:Protein of unknown function (DUF3105)